LRICSNQDDFGETWKTGRWIPNPETEVGERRRKAWQFATKLRRQQTAKKEGTLFRKERKLWRKDNLSLDMMKKKVEHFLEMKNKQKPSIHFFLSKIGTKNAFIYYFNRDLCNLFFRAL